jgi:hypothetical protein
VFALAIAALYAVRRWYNGENAALRVLQAVLIGVSVIVFFDGSNRVNRVHAAAYRARNLATNGVASVDDGFLWDATFLRWDEFCLGWLGFPRGQLSLWLDQNTAVGVTSAVAPYYTEVLQVLYTSYYFWGNGLLLFLCVRYACKARSRSSSSAEALSIAWRRVQLFATAWVATFMLNFVLNLTFPAVSPRIYLKQEYKNDIRAMFLGNVLRAGLAAGASDTYSVFPSGHCGLSWLTVVLAYQMRFRAYSGVAGLAAVLITCATLVLRYHYFVDFACASVLVVFGMYAGHMRTAQQCDAALRQHCRTRAVNRVDDDDNVYDAVELAPL